MATWRVTEQMSATLKTGKYRNSDGISWNRRGGEEIVKNNAW
jgi:hypothetical protein